MGPISADVEAEQATRVFFAMKFNMKASGTMWEIQQSSIFYTIYKRSRSSVLKENGLYFNYFCSVIPIYELVKQLRDWLDTRYFLKPFYTDLQSHSFSGCSLTRIEMFC